VSASADARSNAIIGDPGADCVTGSAWDHAPLLFPPENGNELYDRLEAPFWLKFLPVSVSRRDASLEHKEHG
jgi:hypothetical protein